MMRGLDRHAGEAPQGPHPRRGGRGRGPAVAPLHHRPPAARQVGQPARHRLRPRRPRPDRRPRRPSRTAAARSSTSSVEIGILEREGAAGADHDERLAEDSSSAWRRPSERAGRPGEALGAGEAAWSSEIRGLRDQLEKHHAAGKAKGERPGRPRRRPRSRSSRAELDARTAELRQLQGETPLMQVVRRRPGDRRGRLGLDRHPRRQDGRRRDQHRAAPQGRSWRSASSARRTPWRRSASASAPRGPTSTDPRRPIGVFLLVGPSGVGKTETALALADLLYGGERNMIIINMSEYKEAHKVSQPQGLAPGLRRLRRGRRADRGGPPQALQRRAARRGREGPPRRAGALLPGVRQGHARRTARGARSTSRTRSSC